MSLDQEFSLAIDYSRTLPMMLAAPPGWQTTSLFQHKLALHYEGNRIASSLELVKPIGNEPTKMLVECFDEVVQSGRRIEDVGALLACGAEHADWLREGHCILAMNRYVADENSSHLLYQGCLPVGVTYTPERGYCLRFPWIKEYLGIPERYRVLTSKNID